jgi:hypothetical protein
MRHRPLFSSAQHTLPFARHEIWQSLPAEQRQQCRDLCEQLLRAVLIHDEGASREENPEREDSRRPS